MENRLSYEGKRVVVTGAASGIGAATARLVRELGASHVFALDVRKAEVGDWIETDLAKKESIDAAVRAIGASVDALFNCAGLPGPPFSDLETMLVNFVGLRHLSNAIAETMPRGGAIASVSSVAGMGYLRRLADLRPLLTTLDFDQAKAWCAANGTIANGYPAAKECVIAWTQMRAKELGPRGIRINCISPGVTETPMLAQFDALVGRDWMEAHLQGYLGRNARPEEAAWALAFLDSNAASFVSGANLFVDAGYSGALTVGAASPPPPPRHREEAKRT
jgi:NAD(P)-dependent dehydrogenase (short-subunit alcohol dehydrogenase family)